MCTEYTGVWFTKIQIKSTKVFYIVILFKVRFIQDSGLFSVWFRKISFNKVIFAFFILYFNIILLMN
jgi:hypothetical protein